METGRLVRVHLTEVDKHGDRPLYEAVLALCREYHIAGATVFRGLEGFGNTAIIHQPHLMATDSPISVVIVDSEERVKSLLPALEQLVDTALIAVSIVQMRRVKRNST